MKEIQLSKGQVALVDDWNYEELNRSNWNAIWSEDVQSYYAIREEYKPFRITIYMHRQIMNTPKGFLCDHINHQTLLNVESNLRNVTPSESATNRRVRFDSISGEKCIQRTTSGFRVHVRKGKKIVFQKAFRTLDAAIIARDEAIKKYHGEFAYLPER